MKTPSKLAARLSALGLVVALAATGLAATGLRSASADRVSSAAPASRADTTEANITRLTANVLQSSQFAHHPLDSELANKFLDGYLDAIDSSRLLFTQSDVKEFEVYRKTLARDTREQGDTRAAQAIWQRYLQRLGEQVNYVEAQLKTQAFSFTGNDSYSFDREHAQRPVNTQAAQHLWLRLLRAEYLDLKLRDIAADEIAATLTRRYDQQLHSMQALGPGEVLEIYLTALAHVYDPHSDYMGHEQMEDMAIAMNLSLFGIGASLATVDGYCEVREVIAGGPAARAGGLQRGDRILAVSQDGKQPVDIVNMPLSHAVQMIRGPKGSRVTLTVVPAGSADASVTKSVTLVRDQIRLEDQRAKASVVDLPVADGTSLRLGVIDLPSFYAEMGPANGSGQGSSVTADVAVLLNKLNAVHVQGIVVDLRHNGGGSLDEAVNLTGLFIPQGPVVQTRGPDGDIEVNSDTDPRQQYAGPLVLLTSRFSASASEILAGALKDYGRALIVGDPATFGKGTVQSVLPLARVMSRGGLAMDYDPGALKVTIRKFYRPSGASTQLRGVAADLVLPSGTDFSEVSEAAMKDPLPWDTVTPARYETLARITPYLKPLKQKSAQRVAKEKGFAYLKEDLAKLKERVAAKTVSLNEAKRRADLAQAKERQALRERERAAQPDSAATIYEISVQNASAPGLPPAKVKPAATPVAEGKPQNGSAVVPAGTATAALSYGANPAGPIPTADDSAANDAPADDVVLNETVHILADYVQLQHAQVQRRPGAK